jgi:hypothetical protein
MPRRIGHVREPTEEVRSVDVTKRVELLERAQDTREAQNCEGIRGSNHGPLRTTRGYFLGYPSPIPFDQVYTIAILLYSPICMPVVVYVNTCPFRTGRAGAAPALS